ncbi:disease resistance protein Roq1-like, partial [Rhodamnia argentea]|uniref:Disease resistance protein Roq1-like n=1 Tax=Rhodamnia argentea TaxID=178133 RepID=A0A8B8MZU7_9MYRT
MRRLRLLILRNVHNSFQGPICIPNQLRWFEWPGAPSIPEFSSGPKKLVGLGMSKSSITTVAKQFKDFQQLKYIKLSYCESLVSMPDLSCTPNLEELDLGYCKKLVEVHESVAYHDKLQELKLTGCSKLSVFPKVLKSKHLQALYLDGCKKFERFPDIPNELEGLEELWLLGTAIKELLASIENLVSLESLFLDNCNNLTSLPSSIYNLQNLESLGIRGCTNFTRFPKYEDSLDPRMKTGLSSLGSLRLEGCSLSEVEFLENLSCFPFLRQLRLTGNNMTGLPTSLNKRAHLSHLIVENCRQLEEIPELPPSISYLSADGCESLKNNGDLTSLHHFVRKGLAMADIYSTGRMPDGFIIILDGGDMPEWIFPIEGSISFMASKDLYDKFLALALCFVLCNDESEEIPLVVSHANGKRLDHLIHYSYESNLDQMSLEYLTPCELWEEVEFSQIDGSYVRFSISSTAVKKWGFRILCKPLEDDLKEVLQENKLIDPALLYEVCHES